MRRWLPVLMALTMLGAYWPARAIDPLPFKDRAQEIRFQQLSRQLRCLVCQNESLADSNAALARDLRHQVFHLMQQGKSDAYIKQYLVARYSDYVLYRPPLRPSTWLLWFGPGVLLIVGALGLAGYVRRRAAAPRPIAEADNQDI